MKYAYIFLGSSLICGLSGVGCKTEADFYPSSSNTSLPISSTTPIAFSIPTSREVLKTYQNKELDFEILHPASYTTFAGKELDGSAIVAFEEGSDVMLTVRVVEQMTAGEAMIMRTEEVCCGVETDQQTINGYEARVVDYSGITKDFPQSVPFMEYYFQKGKKVWIITDFSSSSLYKTFKFLSS